MLRKRNLPLSWRCHDKDFSFLGVLCFFTILGFSSAWGQNTGLVFSPEVVADETLVDFRIGYSVDDDRMVFRSHLQHSFSDSFNLRGLFLHMIDSSDKWDFRFFRIEGLWQFLESEQAGWDSALRFELGIAADDDLPNQVRVAWSGKYDIDDQWRVAGNFLTGFEIGSEAEPEALFEIRGQISRRLSEVYQLSIDYFGNMNNVEALDDWQSHQHQTGPTLNIQLNQATRLTVGALFGLSRDASGMEYRLMVAHVF